MKLGIIIEGGIGKHILFSSLLPELKKKNGELILVSAHPSVFVGNPNIFRNFGFQHPYLYDDYLKNIPVKRKEPYLEDMYRIENKSLLETYCYLFGLENNQVFKPQVFIFFNEEQECLNYLNNQLRKKYILIQISGGSLMFQPIVKISRARDYPLELAQDFVDKFKKQFPDYEVLQIGLPHEPILKNVIPMVNLQIRQTFPLMKFCETFVAIDSFLQHLSACFDKKGIVLWGGTNPKKLGWEHNINLFRDGSCPTLFCHRPETYFFDNADGILWDCPYQFNCMKFDPDLILSKIFGILKGGENNVKSN